MATSSVPSPDAFDDPEEATYNFTERDEATVDHTDYRGTTRDDVEVDSHGYRGTTRGVVHQQFPPISGEDS